LVYSFVLAWFYVIDDASVFATVTALQ